jgi:Rrf2 family transcriptional regulator, iron-sulfur cluster assembly transcription factor
MRLLIELANNSDRSPVTVGEISKRQNISVKYLEQLIHLLKKAQLIASVRGAKGGHLMAERPAAVSFGRIIRLMEGQGDSDECFCHKEKCTMVGCCPLNMAWQKALDAFFLELDAVSIADLSKGCCK